MPFIEWEEVEAWRKQKNAETAEWSRNEMGKDYRYFANAVSITSRCLEVLDKGLQEGPPDHSLIIRFQAARLQTEFAFTRLLNAWDLLLEGYHYDARGLQRVAWEAVNRAGLYILDEEAATQFLDGKEMREGEVRKKLNAQVKEVFPEEWGKQGDVLTEQFKTLSAFNHSYNLGVVLLQSIVNKHQVGLSEVGVRKRQELYVSLALNVFLMQRIPGLLREPLSRLDYWSMELGEQINQSEKDRKQLDVKIQREFPLEETALTG